MSRNRKGGAGGAIWKTGNMEYIEITVKGRYEGRGTTGVRLERREDMERRE